MLVLLGTATAGGLYGGRGGKAEAQQGEASRTAPSQAQAHAWACARTHLSALPQARVIRGSWPPAARASRAWKVHLERRHGPGLHDRAHTRLAHRVLAYEPAVRAAHAHGAVAGALCASSLSFALCICRRPVRSAAASTAGIWRSPARQLPTENFPDCPQCPSRLQKARRCRSFVAESMRAGAAFSCVFCDQNGFGEVGRRVAVGATVAWPGHREAC